MPSFRYPLVCFLSLVSHLSVYPGFFLPPLLRCSRLAPNDSVSYPLRWFCVFCTRWVRVRSSFILRSAIQCDLIWFHLMMRLILGYFVFCSISLCMRPPSNIWNWRKVCIWGLMHTLCLCSVLMGTWLVLVTFDLSACVSLGYYSALLVWSLFCDHGHTILEMIYVIITGTVYFPRRNGSTCLDFTLSNIDKAHTSTYVTRINAAQNKH